MATTGLLSNLARYFRSKPPSLEIGKELSRGAYGAVHSGRLDGGEVAVKRIHRLLLEAAREQGESENVLSDFQRECELHERLDHPHVVKFKGAFYDEATNEPILVMELMTETLRQYLLRNRGQLSRQKQLEICVSIVRGVHVLHAHTPPIVHRDLTDKNVLLDANGVVKISDLGQSRLKIVEYFNTATPGAIPFMPPEAMVADSSYNEKLDIFSLGVLVLEVATQQFPCVGLVGIGTIPELQRRRENLSKLDDDHPLRPVILSCLKDNPKERPDIATVLTQLLAMLERFDLQTVLSTASRSTQEVCNPPSGSELQTLLSTASRSTQEVCNPASGREMSEGKMLLGYQFSFNESEMEELCYAPFGIKDLIVTPDGGIFPLGSNDASLEVPQGAVMKTTAIHYAIILHGPFVLPTGYRAVSVVVYLNFNGATLLQPIFLFLSDWCEKTCNPEHCELMFFSAPHEIEGEKKQYQFTRLCNANQQNVDKLRITESKTFYVKVLQEGHGVRDLYCMMPIQKEAENCLSVRILFFFSSASWKELLTKLYIEENCWQTLPEIAVCETFSMNEPVTAILKPENGPGWIAKIQGLHKVTREAVKANLLQYTQASELQKAIEEEKSYPPSVKCRITYTLPKTARSVPTQLTIFLNGADCTYSCDIMEAASPPPTLDLAEARDPTPANYDLVNSVLQKFQRPFFLHMAAKLIAPELLTKGVIHQTVFDRIDDSRTEEKARRVIFDHLKQYGTVDSLKRFCRVIRSEDFCGVPAMQDLGKKMEEDLENMCD